ncbi:hypothetical protein CIB48_g5284 [Xylaria polymorpha]|nr:hypothetical protein CIB48_g5284 [Xylaria polymorpha]
MADVSTESETRVLKDPAGLKKPAKPLPNFSRQSKISPPIEHGCREHAGEVRRRNDRTVRAQPPPPQPAQAKTINGTRSNQGRKKQTNGFNDDDDSDSDRDSTQRGFGDRGGGVIVRKKTQPPLTSNGDLEVRPPHSIAGPSTSMRLTPEEEERVQLQRQIARQRKTDDGTWDRFLRTRSVNRRHTRENKRFMLRNLQNDPKGQQLLHHDPKETPVKKQWPNFDVFQYQQSQMDRYLDEALCHDIADGEDDNYLSIRISRRELLEHIIREAEDKFVIWWERFVTPEESTVKAVVESLWTDNTWITKYGGQPQRHPGVNVKLGAFAASYERCILTELGLSFLFDERPNTTEGLVCEWQKWFRDRSKYPDTIENLCLLTSQQNRHLSKKYIDWVCSGTPPHLVDSCCQQKLQQIRGANIREMLGSGSTSQEFCQDIDHPGSLSLLLFKGGMLFSIQPVSRFDQEQMGWHRTGDAHMGFYRYEVDRELGHTFKVGVNGELLAVWTPRGEAYWEGGKSRHADDDRWRPIIVRH